MGDRGHNRHGPKTGGCAPFSGKLRPHLTQRRLGRGLLHTKWHLSPSSRFATTDIGRKLGGLCPFRGGELSPHITQCRLGRDIQPFGHNRYGPKIGGSDPFLGRGAGSPSNTVWPEPRPICMLSFILIHPTVWPQYTNVTDRQTGQTDRQTDRQTDGTTVQ